MYVILNWQWTWKRWTFGQLLLPFCLLNSNNGLLRKFLMSQFYHRCDVAVVVMRSTEHWWSLPVYTERRFVQGAVGVYRVRVAKSNAPFASVLLHVVTPTTTVPTPIAVRRYAIWFQLSYQPSSTVLHVCSLWVELLPTVVIRSSCLLLVSASHPFLAVSVHVTTVLLVCKISWNSRSTSSQCVIFVVVFVVMDLLPDLLLTVTWQMTDGKIQFLR